MIWITALFRLAGRFWMPLRSGQANIIFEVRLKGVQTAVLPLAGNLLSAVHAPGPAHETQSIDAVASPGVPEGSRGRKNLNAAAMKVTVRTQF